MKAVWKGFLGFGLVNIGVSLYSAIGEDKADFRMLHKECKAPINYKRVCSECGKEIPYEDIVKGLEVGKNEYYIFTKEELKNMRPKGNDFIEINEFVKLDQIEYLYTDKHYFVGPQEGNLRAFSLLKTVLEDNELVAIGTFVMREKEYPCFIKNYNNGLLLTTMHYSHQIRDMSKVPTIGEEIELKEKEIELANQLIEKLKNDSFNLTDYKDTFAENLKEAIKRKEEGEPIKYEERPEREETQDLIESLRASVEK